MGQRFSLLREHAAYLRRERLEHRTVAVARVRRADRADGAAIAEALGVTTDYLIGREEVTLADAEDKAFFREYSQMPDDTREKIRAMARLLGGKKE